MSPKTIGQHATLPAEEFARLSVKEQVLLWLSRQNIGAVFGMLVLVGGGYILCYSPASIPSAIDKINTGYEKITTINASATNNLAAAIEHNAAATREWIEASRHDSADRAHELEAILERIDSRRSAEAPINRP